ncbi:MAG TPA: hypothetical protein VEY67_05190 [Candidatus Dormibacteraeota bacterium]|nr:hypothetical protein [Candidatus Dormibacteraeota bacterium]
MTAAAPASERSRRGRARGRGLLDAMSLALLHPSTWPVALAGFLARGGILLFVLPVVVLPTPTGLATAFGPDIIAVAIAAPTAAVIELAAAAVALLAGWLVFGSLVGAAADVALAGWVARASLVGDAPGPPASPAGRLVVRVALARLACHLPLLLAGSWAVARIVSAVYREYISPGDLAVALPIRVIRSVPEAIVLLVAAWLIGEMFGGLAARGIVLEGRPLAAAIRGSVVSTVLHPVSAGASLAIGTVLVLVAIVPSIGFAAFAWSALRHELVAGAGPGAVLVATSAFAAAWLGGLVATAAATSVRSAIWTWHALRAPAMAPFALTAPVAVTVPESPVSDR